MVNLKPCGTCEHYWAIEKGLKNGQRKTLIQGYCLDRSIFAENKPGNPVYPPKAKIEFRENAVHKIEIVMANEVRKHCGKYKGRTK
jgi:hypothetical protein